MSVGTTNSGCSVYTGTMTISDHTFLDGHEQAKTSTPVSSKLKDPNNGDTSLLELTEQRVLVPLLNIWLN